MYTDIPLENMDNEPVRISSYNKSKELAGDSYIVLDIETTGFSAVNDYIIQIAAIKYENAVETDCFCEYIKPPVIIPENITKLTGISNEQVKDCKAIEEILPELLSFLNNDYIICHNASFDIPFIQTKLDFCGLPLISNSVIDTLYMSRSAINNVENHKLETLKEYLGIDAHSHNALDDCRVTAKLYEHCYEHIDELPGESDSVNSHRNTQKPKTKLLTMDNVDEHITKIPRELDGKRVVFKGTLVYADFEVYSYLCEKANGIVRNYFWEKSTDYIVFGSNTYEKNFLHGNYSYYAREALELQEEGTLKILSEDAFLSMFGMEEYISEHKISKKPYRKYNKLNISEIVPDEAYRSDVSCELNNSICVFTGELAQMTRREAMQAVVNLGGQLGSSVTTKTTHLIVSNTEWNLDETHKSSKHKKAEEYFNKGYGIKIISENDFYEILDNA